MSRKGTIFSFSPSVDEIIGPPIMSPLETLRKDGHGRPVYYRGKRRYVWKSDCVKHKRYFNPLCATCTKVGKWS